MKQLTLEQVKQKANKHMIAHEYKKALSLIKDYLTSPNKDLLEIYINCKIRLGLYKDAMEGINLLLKVFPEVYAKNPFGLAIVYAKCHQIELVMNILKENKFREDEYFNLAVICYRNSMYEIAKHLFQAQIEAEDISRREQSKNYLTKLAILNDNPDTFLEKGYNSFKYLGNELKPGHIIQIRKLRNEYEENKDQRKKSRYMIWRIEKEKIYAFPVTTTILSGQHRIPKENYPVAEHDRYLLSNLVCINIEDIDTVVDKLKSDDYESAIDTMYSNMCKDKLGDWPKTIEYFMGLITEEREKIPFSVILVKNPTPKFYCIWRIVEGGNQYQVFEVNSAFQPGPKLEIINIPTSTPIFAVLYPNTSPNKTREVTKPSTHKKRGNKNGSNI